MFFENDKFPSFLHLLTVFTAIPACLSQFYLMRRVLKLKFRSSTQVAVHVVVWIGYWISGCTYSTYSLFTEPTLRSSHTVKMLIVCNLTFVLLLPWAVFCVTVDRCVSLRFPTYYTRFNGPSMRLATVVVGSILLVGTLLALWMTVGDVELLENCYLIECLPVSCLMHWLAVYKMCCGLLNIIASVLFIYLYLKYQRQNNNTIERFRNLMVFLFLLTETLNVLPATLYCAFYCLTSSWTRMFQPLILASVNIEGICTSVVYVETFRRRYKCLMQRSKQIRTRALSFPQSTSIYILPQSATRRFGSVSSGLN